MGVPRQGTEQGAPFLPRKRMGAWDCMGRGQPSDRKQGVITAITAWPMSEGYGEKRQRHAPTVYGGGRGCLRPEGTLP